MSESTPDSESFNDNDIDEAEKEGSGWTLNCRKRRHLSGGSASSQATIIDAHRGTVIFKPQDPTKLIAKLNPLTLSQELDSITPNGVIQIRPNYRLNLLAIDMRDNSSMKTILTLTILLGIKFQTYEAHPRSSAVGIIRDVDKDITETDLKKAISATTPVILVKRLGASETVKLVFATETMPEHVVVGHIRFRVLQYTDKPRQCHKCRRFGHIQTACPMCNAAAAVAALTTASTAKPTNLEQNRWNSESIFLEKPKRERGGGYDTAIRRRSLSCSSKSASCVHIRIN
ncbi:hypothetical protein HPB47_017153 [Ixodes persulcatus]|uniref:Uncharacterized protein n=1 Tax=Ixodes persulcatus TaxID=34615 RepID=A0AC60QSM3_IXOPE|nr:hypothetical protein HPB47_017153 [Ixodes persulcatus]